MHTAASAAWFVGAQCSAGDTVQKPDPASVVDFGPPEILKARRDCVLHTIKLIKRLLHQACNFLLSSDMAFKKVSSLDLNTLSTGESSMSVHLILNLN